MNEKTNIFPLLDIAEQNLSNVLHYLSMDWITGTPHLYRMNDIDRARNYCKKMMDYIDLIEQTMIKHQELAIHLGEINKNETKNTKILGDFTAPQK